MEPVNNNPAVYKQECFRGIDLFQKSLEAYQDSRQPQQKDAFKDVMDKALTVIRETVPQCINEQLQKQEEKLEEDYRAYLAAPTPQNLQKINRDLYSLKEQLG